jgi:ABC-type amino acid transport substrate-binding protein
MKDKSGKLIGLEIDLITALANAMGLEALFNTMAFAELLPALNKGDVDLVISGMTITPERNAKVAFVGPYFITGKSLLAKPNIIEEAANIAALNNPKRSYASVAGSTSEEFVHDVLPKAKIVTTKDHDQAVQLVIDGKVDALIADFQICAFAAWQNPEADLEILHTPFTVEPLGIALPADDPLLVNLVTNYLATLEYTGLLGQFKAKWLSAGSWLDELP